MQRQTSLAYDVEANWILNLICNFSCSYCFSSAPRDPRLAGKLSPSAYLDFFESTGKRWLFHMTGGEPFFHRRFVELCSELSKNHYLSINSNLSSSRVAQFAREVKAERVAYIHCGIHPEERRDRKGWPALLSNLTVLIDAGYPVFASCVMTPAAFDLFEDARDRLGRLGVPLIPKLLEDRYQQRFYPQDYTDQEREKFIELSKVAGGAVDASPLKPFRHRPTINPLLDRHFLNGVPDYAGIMCSAGRSYVSIGPDGNIYACGNHHRIGNVFRREMRFLSEDQPCRSDTCRYYCFRHSVVDEVAAQRLPVRPIQTPLAMRVTEFMQKAERAIVNRLVQISLAE